MIYSCFNEQTGQYDYFQNGTTYPVNGDLPTPPSRSVAGSVGVPSREAGRDLPGDAAPAGSGRAARGMIVNCHSSGFGELGEGTKAGGYIALGFVLAIVVLKFVL